MKKNKTLVLVLGILLAAAVVVGLIFGVKALLKNSGETTTTGDTVTGEPATGDTGNTEPSATEPEDPAITAVRAKDVYTDDKLTADDSRLEDVVAECGDYKLSNRLTQIFYGMQYASFMNNYGAYAEYIGLDSTKSLKDQVSSVSNLTWEQYFLYEAMEEFHQYAAVASAAKAEGYVLPEDEQANMETFLSEMEADAASYGFASTDAYIQDSFGDTVRFEDYAAYLQLYFQAMSYQNSIYMGIQPTDEDLQAYVDAHPDDYADMDFESTSIDVRHILILSDPDEDGTATEEEKAAAKAKAEELLAEYLEDPTEEHFADLANLNSQDPGSNTKGGLYEGVTEGYMVEAFNDWCFDESRQIGDTGIVETEYGYHVMFFAGSDLQWKSKTRNAIRMEIVTDRAKEIIGEYPMTVRYEDVVLGILPMAEPLAE